MQIRKMIALFLFGLLAFGVKVEAGESKAQAGWVGYRGPNGTGVFTGSNPPVSFDAKTGQNIRWRTPLPNWSHGAPTIVKDRAFVLSEAGWKHDWPVLTCIDTTSGKVLWEREINHLPVTGLSAVRQAEIAKQWGEFHKVWRELYTVFSQTAGQRNNEAAIARFAELGFKFTGHRGGGYGQLRSLSPKPQCTIKEAGLRPDVWRHACGLGYDEIGAAFATPVTDGEHVYVVVNRSAVASYDLAGNVRWMTFVPPPKELSGYIETNGRSPLLYKDLLISDHFGYTVALDKATGKKRWEVKTYGGGIGTPNIITIGGTDIFLTESSLGKSCGLAAIRLPDGKHLKISGWGPTGTLTLVMPEQRDTAIFLGGCHTHFGGAPETDAPKAWTKTPAVVKFSLEGETLKPEVLWSGLETAKAGMQAVYHEGKLYTGNVILDASTGKVLAGGDKGRRVVPQTRHYLYIAGNRIYGLSGQDRMCDAPLSLEKPAATLTCYSLDGKELGVSPFYMLEPDEQKKAQSRSQVGWERWGFGYGMPFTISGDRIYLRSSDELICLGER